MFIRLTDGRIAYTDNASFFFILTEPYFRTLLDSSSVLPESPTPQTDSDSVRPRKKTKAAVEN